MRPLHAFLLAGAVVVLLAFANRPTAGGPYEYRFVRVAQGLVAEGQFEEVPTGVLGEQVANELARDGWELDQIDSLWMGGPATQFEALTLVFRRPRH